MKICHVCKAECEDFAEVCPICGAFLIAEEGEADETVSTAVEENLLEDPTLVATVEDVVSAEIFKDILADNEINYYSDADLDDGAMQVSFGGGFMAEHIYVSAKDADLAKTLYNEFLKSEEMMQGFDFSDDFEEEN